MSFALVVSSMFALKCYIQGKIRNGVNAISSPFSLDSHFLNENVII